MAISILLHAWLLWPAVSPPGGGAAAPLVASLRPAPAPAKTIAPIRERQRPPRPSARPAAAVVGYASSQITPDLTAAAPARSEVPAAHAFGMAGGAQETPAPAPAAASGPDADGVREYRLALAREARRFRRYPARAIEAGIGGTVEIRIAVAAGGLAEGAQIARSSGDDSLDDAALEMIGQAMPRAAVPAVLRRQAFVVTLPVVFDAASD